MLQRYGKQEILRDRNQSVNIGRQAMYVTYKEYLSMTGADPDKYSEFAFDRAEYKAERELSRYTT